MEAKLEGPRGGILGERVPARGSGRAL